MLSHVRVTIRQTRGTYAHVRAFFALANFSIDASFNALRLGIFFTVLSEATVVEDFSLGLYTARHWSFSLVPRRNEPSVRAPHV